MSGIFSLVLFAVPIGLGATMAMDVCAVVRERFFGITPMRYRLVGRWVVHLAVGRFRHDTIINAPAMPFERPIGWVVHYLTGIVFAAVLLIVWGAEWANRPTLLPALIVGLGSVVLPFAVMQPGMGFGIAGNRTPDPVAARLRSLTAHGIFGVGLYLSALFLSAVGLPPG